MNSTEIVTIASALLAPVVAAILGFVGIAFQDWRQRRSQAGRRKLALEDAGRQVSFAVEWWSARKLLADSPEVMQEATIRAANWLEEAAARVAEHNATPIEENRPITLRRLLVFYPLQGRAAILLRGVFHGSLALLAFAVGNTITDAFLFPQDLDMGVSIVLTVTGLSLGLRFLVAIVATREPENGTGLRRQLRHWLLLYPFHRRTAKTVRIIFYVLLGGGLLYMLLSFFGTYAESPALIPANAGFAALIILLVVWLRNWAVSLEMANTSRKTADVPSSDTATEEVVSQA
jgi:hypothetical protein